jgi:hypothetical protein
MLQTLSDPIRWSTSQPYPFTIGLGDNGVDFKKTLAILLFWRMEESYGIETVVLSNIEDT